jgi:hypothetical protein
MMTKQERIREQTRIRRKLFDERQKVYGRAQRAIYMTDEEVEAVRVFLSERRKAAGIED